MWAGAVMRYTIHLVERTTTHSDGTPVVLSDYGSAATLQGAARAAMKVRRTRNPTSGLLAVRDAATGRWYSESPDLANLADGYATADDGGAVQMLPESEWP